MELFLSPEAFHVVNEEGERIVDSDEFVLYVGIFQPDERSCALLGTRPKEISLIL